MSRIITITFNPCIDKSISVHTLVPEKKLACNAPVLEPGGGGINVARAIRKLGGEATAIYPSGGYTGRYLDQLMANEQVPSVIIPTANETRENIIVLEESTKWQFRLGMPGTELLQNEWKQLLQSAEAINNISFIVVSGSLPPGVPPDIIIQIGAIAKKKNALLIADTSGEALKHAMQAGAYLVKPSLRELASLANKDHLLSHEVAGAARKALDSSNCKNMVVSMGSNGAMLVTKDSKQTITPPTVKTQSTVGAGDSMVAGMVLSLAGGKSMPEAARYGVACGTAATLNPGTQLCQKEAADKLYELIDDTAVLPLLTIESL